MSIVIILRLYNKSAENYWEGKSFSNKQQTKRSNDIVEGAKRDDVDLRNISERSFQFELTSVGQLEFINSSIWKWKVFDGNLWVIGTSNQTFYKLDDKGNVLQQWGRDGGAPWENEEVANFHIEDEKFYIVDRDKREVKIVEKNNEVLFYRKLDTPFWSGSFVGKNNLVFVSESGPEFRFTIEDLKQSTESSSIDIAPLLGLAKPYPNMNIAYEGYFTSNNTKAAYVSLKAGKFFIINTLDGNVKAFDTIDKTEPPKISIRELSGLNIFLRDPDHNVNYSSCMDSDYLYILSTVLFKRKDELNLDIYKLSTGEYIGSANIPNYEDQYPIDITKSMNGNDIYVLYEDQMIIKYEINASSEKK